MTTPTPPVPMPVAISPDPLCVIPTGETVPCLSTPPTVTTVLPATGGGDLALACVGLGFVLLGATLVGPLRRRGGGQ